MTEKQNPKADPNEPMVYQIRVKARLDLRWAEWFGEMTLTPHGDGETLITGPVVDQAALHGLLKKVRDLGLPLIAVSLVQPGEPGSSLPGAAARK